MVSSNSLFYLSTVAVVTALITEYVYVTQSAPENRVIQYWDTYRTSEYNLNFVFIVIFCTLPYFMYLVIDFLFFPLIYEKALVGSEEEPANLPKRYRNSGKVPPPYPNGWFYVSHSEHLKKGDVKQISVLGGEFALFRGEDGKARMISAFCPHLGANLAIGGKVTKNCLSCPFHGWKFDGDTGKCTDIPYSKNIPNTAHTDTVPVSEINGVIYMWHHSNGEEPSWDVPPAEGVDTWKFRCDGFSKHEVCAHIQEIPENGADNAHLNILHTTPVVEFLGRFGFTHGWSASWNTLTGDKKHISEINLTQCFRFFDFVLPLTTLNVTINQIGPGIVVLQFNTSIGRAYIVQSVTPLEPMLQLTVHSVHMPWYIPRIVGKGLLQSLVIQVERDVPIWNNKTYTPQPLLCKGDGKIAAFRRWYSQFYTPEDIQRAKTNNSILDW